MTPIRMIQYPVMTEASRRAALGLPPRSRARNSRRCRCSAVPWDLLLLLLIVTAAAAFVWLSL